MYSPQARISRYYCKNTTTAREEKSGVSCRNDFLIRDMRFWEIIGRSFIANKLYKAWRYCWIHRRILKIDAWGSLFFFVLLSRCEDRHNIWKKSIIYYKSKWYFTIGQNSIRLRLVLSIVHVKLQYIRVKKTKQFYSDK